MDDIITRIVDIERQCSADVEAVQIEYKNNIEDHKRFLEEKKSRECADILSGENIRLSQAVEEAKKQSDVTSNAFITDIENIFKDQSLNELIKENIISILLES
ncbi:MAG: hypothetical protein APR62_00630 [Smithella sp. SDB]|nr:MAG: hypothetical protein APR62_00630 [Smithella sp. SDB]